MDSGRIVLVNGRYVEALSDKLPIRVAVNGDAIWPARAEDAMVALNEAMTAESYRIAIPDGESLDEPIEIVHVAAGDTALAVYSRLVIGVGAKARVSVLETFLGGSPRLQRNAATALALAEGANLKHVVSVEDDAGLHIESLVGRLAAGAEFKDFALVAGGALSRRQLFLDIAGEDAKVALGGLSLVDGARRADTTLQVTHSAPRGTSREFYRAIVDDDGVGTFQGKIIVAKQAQKTDGAMKSQAVLLSPSAQMNAKPELEIFADDVVCGHGATVASLDPEQLFYLQARGIPRRRGRGDASRSIRGRGDGAAGRRSSGQAAAHTFPGLASRQPAAGRRGGKFVSRLAERTLADYDVEKIRADFPILAEKPYGKPLVYFDNAASAQKPRAVVDRLVYAYEHEYANVHRGLHYLANAATEAYEAARETVRRFLNAGSAEEIVFTRSATEAINLVASSFGQRIGEGDEIVLSVMEHHSNVVPWHFLRERKGAVLRWVDVADDGSLSLEAFEQALNGRTKIVAITQMSNVLGTAPPVKEMIRLAHSRGVPVLVDGSQGAVHLDVDVRDLDADFYVVTGHKLYGPTGIGALYGKREWLEALPPYMGGGEMIEEVTRDTVTYNQPPHRFEAGTPPIVQAIGLGAALDYIEGIGKARIRAHEAAVSAYAHERLGAINSLRVIGTAPGKGPILSFTMQNAHAHDIATLIDRSGVAVRAGTHCAMPLMQRFGVTSTCRASFALYNTLAEVDALAEALDRAQKLFV